MVFKTNDQHSQAYQERMRNMDP